jgi:hypothetical protein
MEYDSGIHHRHSIRLKGYDYSQAGLYFITICIHETKCLFGNIVGASLAGARMELNDFGNICLPGMGKFTQKISEYGIGCFSNNAQSCTRNNYV